MENLYWDDENYIWLKKDAPGLWFIHWEYPKERTSSANIAKVNPGGMVGTNRAWQDMSGPFASYEEARDMVYAT